MQKAQKTALITGIAGQDGSYLAELLIAKEYRVIGTVRNVEQARERLPQEISASLELIPAAEPTQAGFDSLIHQTRPDEVYNLAGLSFVPTTARDPAWAAEEIAMTAIRLMQAIRKHAPAGRFYQACSSEMFGTHGPFPQNEETALAPSSPYGAAKAYTCFSTVQFRDLFGLFATAGILFNHESPRRPPTFVSRRITQGAARIKMGHEKSLKLGNLDAQRDWGYSKDYVHAMWLMLQQSKPENYVIATGILHKVRDFVEIAFDEVGLDWRKHVEVDETLVRPTEERPLVGNPTKAREQLKWQAETSFEDLVRLMVREDLKLLKT
jgi:GDPmannose 4,6-dehydratase